MAHETPCDHTKAVTKMARMTIHGGGLTEAVRNLVLSERVRSAIAALDQIDGMSQEQRYDILKGDAELETVRGELQIKARTDTAYQEELREVYAGRFQIRSGWYRPVQAFGVSKPLKNSRRATFGVKQLGPDGQESSDVAPYRHSPVVPWASDDDGPKQGENVRWVGAVARAACQMGDIVVQGGRGLEWYRLEPCGEPPFWLKPAKNLEEAVQQLGSISTVYFEDMMYGYGRDAANDAVESLQRQERVDTVLLNTGGVPQMEDLDLPHEAPSRTWSYQELEQEGPDYEKLGAQVRERAGSDLFELKSTLGSVMVPRVPFLHWGLNRTKIQASLPAWEPICPSGLKMCNDNPMHTDWVLGAGLQLEDAYTGPWRVAADDFIIEILVGHGVEARALAGEHAVSGVIGENIAVLPDLDPKWLDTIIGKVGVITARGGKMAHLANVGREQGIVIMLCPDTARFVPGQRVMLDPACGKIETEPFGS